MRDVGDLDPGSLQLIADAVGLGEVPGLLGLLPGENLRLNGGIRFTGFGNDLQTSFSAAVACLGNVGPGFSKVGSMNNYATLNAATKAVGIMLMFLGRLEIFEILQLFYSHRSE